MKEARRYYCSCLLFCGIFLSGSVKADHEHVVSSQPDFLIVDSWLTGLVSGFCKGKEERLRNAWKEAGHRAVNDMRIWGGLFVSDTNRTGINRMGEVLSRFTYQSPQTAGGFLTAHFYNTIAGKVNRIEYGFGTTVLNMRVTWPGVALGSYILAKPVIEAVPDNKMFQHEYGHYLQSKRMGFAYFVCVGIPAVMSKGDHDAHPVEIDCNRRAFLYFNEHIPGFRQDSLLADNKGWNFYFNPFPETVGEPRVYRERVIQYVNYSDTSHRAGLNALRVQPQVIDYAGWAAFPLPFFIGWMHAGHYNRELLRKTDSETADAVH